MKKRTIKVAVIMFTVLFAVNDIEVFAYTQDEYRKILEEEDQRRGLNSDDYRGTGGVHPELHIDYSQNSEATEQSSVSPETAQATTPTPTPKHEHKYTANLTTNPTCTEEGVITYTCDCGDTYTVAQPKLEHQYEEEITKNATCAMEGEKIFTCTLCKDTYSEIIPMLEHEEGQHLFKDATCVKEGIDAVYCKDCNCLMETTTIPRNPERHTAGEEVIPINMNTWYCIGAVALGLIILTIIIVSRKKRKNK